ncbi:hypothetical protein VNO77_22624 [Canavalia gladiata]|uniref:Uncharacterized protein n=1 Tax=Canavalia gladiata TaxID=3824 RepID=A0AAN9L2X8_CANGL
MSYTKERSNTENKNSQMRIDNHLQALMRQLTRDKVKKIWSLAKDVGVVGSENEEWLDSLEKKDGYRRKEPKHLTPIGGRSSTSSTSRLMGFTIQRICCISPVSGQMINGRLPIPVQRPSGTANSGTVSSPSLSMPRSQSQTVVVENPMSIDSSGKLVSNVVVGVTTDKK